MPTASVEPRLLATLMSVEWRTRRVLGAVRFEDRATRDPVSARLQVRIPGVEVSWNLSGLAVLVRARGLEPHTEAFRAAPGNPPPESVAFTGTVEDPAGGYLPRSFSVRLPRDPDPNRHEDPRSLFQPVSVALFPAPSAGTAHPLWSRIRVSLARSVEGEKEPLSGALVRITDAAGDVLLGSGLTDARGEGIVFLPGIPPARSSEGGNGDEEEPVVVYELPARIQVVWEPPGEAPPDPDHLEAAREDLIRSDDPLSLKAGRTERFRKTLTMT